MTNHGQCNCGSVSVELSAQELASILCYCHSCRTAGGGYSVNYLVGEDEAVISDPRETLKTYIDTKADSGNKVERQFCSDCGSPVVTRTPKYPGKAFIKASLFGDMAAPAAEVYTSRREHWQTPIEGAKQA